MCHFRKRTHRSPPRSLVFFRVVPIQPTKTHMSTNATTMTSENNDPDHDDASSTTSSASASGSLSSASASSVENNNNTMNTVHNNDYTHDFVQLIFTQEGPLGMEIYRHGNGVLSVRGVASDGQADQICQSILLKPQVFEGATVVSINQVYFQEPNLGLPLWKELRTPQRPKKILFCLRRRKRHERSIAWAAKQKAVGRGGIECACGVNKVFVHQQQQPQVEMVFTQNLLGIRVDTENHKDMCQVENFAKHTEADKIARESLLLNPKVFQNALIRAVNGRKYKSKDAMYDALRSTNRPKSILFELHNDENATTTTTTTTDNNHNDEQEQVSNDDTTTNTTTTDNDNDEQEQNSNDDTTTTTTMTNNNNNNDEQEEMSNDDTTTTTTTTPKSSLLPQTSLLFQIAQTLKPATEPQPQYLPTSGEDNEKGGNNNPAASNGGSSSSLASADENEVNGSRRTSLVKVFGKVATDVTHSVRHLTTLKDKNQMSESHKSQVHEEEEEEEEHQFICI